MVVGTPDGNWTLAGVGPYDLVDFSGFTRVGALLSSSALWVAVLAFPFSMLAIVFAAMTVFVLLLFLVWTQLGEYLTFARAVIIALCIAAALWLIVYCVRTSRKHLAPQS